VCSSDLTEDELIQRFFAPVAEGLGDDVAVIDPNRNEVDARCYRVVRYCNQPGEEPQKGASTDRNGDPAKKSSPKA